MTAQPKKFAFPVRIVDGKDYELFTGPFLPEAPLTPGFLTPSITPELKSVPLVPTDVGPYLVHVAVQKALTNTSVVLTIGKGPGADADIHAFGFVGDEIIVARLISIEATAGATQTVSTFGVDAFSSTKASATGQVQYRKDFPPPSGLIDVSDSTRDYSMMPIPLSDYIDSASLFAFRGAFSAGANANTVFGKILLEIVGRKKPA